MLDLLNHQIMFHGLAATKTPLESALRQLEFMPQVGLVAAARKYMGSEFGALRVPEIFVAASIPILNKNIKAAEIAMAGVSRRGELQAVDELVNCIMGAPGQERHYEPEKLFLVRIFRINGKEVPVLPQLGVKFTPVAVYMSWFHNLISYHKYFDLRLHRT
jgi:hypothetical protein